jgi:hypothetical protein
MSIPRHITKILDVDRVLHSKEVEARASQAMELMIFCNSSIPTSWHKLAQ